MHICFALQQSTRLIINNRIVSVRMQMHYNYYYFLISEHVSQYKCEDDQDCLGATSGY